jgi:hypothetical protein
MGSRLRGAFFMLIASPFFLAADQNGGLCNFGFLPGSQMEHHFKMRPDYITSRMFMAYR